MKTENTNKEARLGFFSSLYENAKNCYSDDLALYERHMKQYRGSDDIDGSGERATTVRNVTYEIIESQVSSDIPHPKVDAACYSERRMRNSLAIERLLYSVRDKLPYEEMNDVDERYTYVYGGSVWYVEWDNAMRLGREVGGVRLHCISPMNFIPQPNVSKIEEMEYCFIRLTATRGELSRRYGIADEALELADYDEYEGELGDTETASLIITFYKDDEGDIGKFIFSGSLTVFDMPKYYRRKVKVCKKCGEGEESCRCAKKVFVDKDEIYEKISSDIILRDGIRIPSLSPAVVFHLIIDRILYNHMHYQNLLNF